MMLNNRFKLYHSTKKHSSRMSTGHLPITCFIMSTFKHIMGTVAVQKDTIISMIYDYDYNDAFLCQI